VQLDADEQSAAAHLADARRAEAVQRLPQPRAPGLDVLVDEELAAPPSAAASGLPPKVEPWLPGVNTSMTASSAQKALTGMTPPPSAFPMVMPSGRMSSCSKHHVRPVRPRPVWISSSTISTPARSHAARTARR
jgi:hypothetical protein